MLNLCDWIKPGEFSFCTRCGDVCRSETHSFMCIECNLDFFGMFPSEQQQSQIDAEKVASLVLCEERMALAQARQASLPRLFWMHGAFA